MSQVLLFALIGLGAGSLYAALGVGVVVGFRGTGIINFAAGAMAVWSAYVYDELGKTGDVVLPVVVVPHRVHLMDQPPFAMTLLIALLSTVLLSLLAHFLVFRPLRTAPVLARVVASVGILLVVQSLILLHFGGDARAMTPILPNETVKFAGAVFPRDRLWLSAIVVVIGAVLWAYLRFTRVGLATRGAAESETTISLAGFSPQMLAGLTWLISGLVTSLVVILAGPMSSLNIPSYVFAIVPALAAALLGRLRSVAGTIVAGLLLGSFQSIVQFLSSKTWWPSWGRAGLSDAVPFLVIVVALFAVGRSLPDRGAMRVDRLPAVRIPTVRVRSMALIGVCGLVLMALLGGGYRFGLITSLIVAMMTLSLVVLTGLVGQISLAQAAIAGTAGFALSKMCTTAGLNFPFGVLLSVVVAMIAGVLVGIPALRIRGAQLAVVTLASGLALERFVFRNTGFVGPMGSKISAPELFGLDLGVRAGRNIARFEFGALVVVITTLCCIVVSNLIRSGTGRRLLAVRSNERAAASVGISVSSTKLVAFAISSALAGLGGCFIGYSRGQLSADSFTVFTGLSILAFAYLGGITSVSGAVLAGMSAPLGLTFVILDRNIDLGESYTLLAGVGLVMTAIFNPQGVAGRVAERWSQLRSSRDAGRAAPSTGSAIVTDTALAAADQAISARRSSADAPVVLRAAGLTVRYGGVTAVGDLDLEVRRGEIVGLIGPNGAGKTSCLDAITGFTPKLGSVTFHDVPIDGLAPHEIARRGLRRTWQSVELFTDISIADNVRVALDGQSLGVVARDLVAPPAQQNDPRIDDALHAVGLGGFANGDTSELSLGQQKLLGVARALVTAPDLLLMDEPAAGLSSSETEALGRRIVEIAERGTSILLIDHDMDLVLEVCDRVYVLDFGVLIASGTPSEIRSDRAVIEAYLGVVSEDVS